jgi:hypothetical protein
MSRYDSTRMRSRLAAAVVAIALGTVGSVVVSSPAQAVDRNCYSNEWCVYKDRDFSTANSMYRFTVSYLDWYYNACEIYEADSSWRNLRSSGAATYTSAGYWGEEICVNGGYQVAYYYWANDDGASHEVDVTC